MPVRLRALSPGEFIRNHLMAVGGMDYPQAIHRAYKDYLEALGYKNGACRATISNYIWVANKLGLVEFDHAEMAERWGAVVDGVTVPRGYVRESRPQAPSPRHYYRILDPTDSRWVGLQQRYRESIGLPVRPPAPPRPPKPPKPPVPPKPPKVKPPPKPPKPPKVKPPKPPKPPAVLAAPYEERVPAILAMLDELERSPSMELIGEIENQLLDLGEDVIEVLPKAKGAERDKLAFLNMSIRQALEHLGLIGYSLEILVAETLPARIEVARESFRAALRVVREDLAL